MPDPIQQTAARITGGDHIMLEHRLKRDMFDAIKRVKPAIAEGVSIEEDVLSGRFFETLTPALQGIAVVKLENAISYYDRIGWRDAWLEMPLESALNDFQLSKITEKTKPSDMHDMSYISHKHIEKMLGKIEAAKLWEQLKAWQPDS